MFDMVDTAFRYMSIDRLLFLHEYFNLKECSLHGIWNTAFLLIARQYSTRVCDETVRVGNTFYKKAWLCWLSKQNCFICKQWYDQVLLSTIDMPIRHVSARKSYLYFSHFTGEPFLWLIVLVGENKSIYDPKIYPKVQLNIFICRMFIFIFSYHIVRCLQQEMYRA